MKEDAQHEVTATELKQNLGKYLARVAEYHEVVISKNGARIARLTPYITDFAHFLAVQERARDYSYNKRKVSYEEFEEIYAKTEQRMEYINGEIVLLDSPGVTHQEVVGTLYLCFAEYLRGKDCKVFLAPFDVHFRKQGHKSPDVCQPDLLIACDLAGNIDANDRYTGIPALVAEVLSPGTKQKDLIDKLNIYTLSGVEEYWIVDPYQKSVLIYNFCAYDIHAYKSYEGKDTALSALFTGLTIPLSTLFNVNKV